MNVLVATVSAFSYNTEERKYDIHIDNCSVDSINARHTNESILKCLVRLYDVIQTGGLHKVIALVSHKTLTEPNMKFNNATAFEYYSEIIEELSENTEVIQIPIENEDGTARNLEHIISEICNEIHYEDNVYIDSAGGLRVMSNLVQLLTVMLKYAGIKNPCTLYSDIQNSQAFISDTKPFIQMTDLADAFNEFMTTGKSDQLQKCCLRTDLHPSFHSLLIAMNEFSDKIRLGNVDNIDIVVSNLKNSIAECGGIEDVNSIESVIIRQFLPVIEKKLIGDKEGFVDYVQLVKWCLENTLIQQALTLFVEKIPLLLYSSKVFEFRGDLQKKKKEFEKLKGPTKHCDWECEALYTDLLVLSDNSNLLVQELKRTLKNEIYPTNQTVTKAVEIIESFKQKFPNTSSKNAKSDCVRKLIAEHKYNSYDKMLNDIVSTKDEFLRILLDEDSKKENVDGDKTLNNKFTALAQIEQSGFKNIDYRLNIPYKAFVELMYGYIYVKALRNQTNHASSKELLVDEQKAILAERGYSFSDDSLNTIKRNISHALDAIIYAIEYLKPKQTEHEEKHEVIPTNLKVGDVVEARSLGEKTVCIEPNCYDIQLVVPRYIQYSVVPGAILKVMIKQISKQGRIMQVAIFED